MKYFLLIIIGIHGLIHLLGFVKAFNYAEINQLTQPISKSSGIIWLMTLLLFVSVFILYLLKSDVWWIFAFAAVVVSQLLIIQYWQDAKFGTIPNLIILIPAIFYLINSSPSSYRNVYKSEVNKRLTPSVIVSVLSENEIKHLPEPVREYLRYTGSVGKPKIVNFRLKFSGDMKRNPSAKWMNISSTQYNFFNEVARLFYIESSIFSIPFNGLHSYTGDSAVMKIKVASLIQVVDAKGAKMNQSENVTLFNDMCLFAPSTLIDKKIKWKPIDPLTAEASFTYNNITIKAMLYFNNKGELINFVSDDRYLSSDGKTFTKYRWSTPVKEYKYSEGRKLVASAEALWNMPEGEFSYARFNLQEIEFNCTEFKE